MRANAAHYDLISEPTLAATLDRLAEGTHTLIAGGTELMVAFSAGRLPQRPLLSISHLQELRFIRMEAGRIVLGAGTTFTDLRRSRLIATELPLLALAASWTGSIANQNRGTLGGNIVNASPAADSPPALLCYEAEIHLISSAGTRTIPYANFHLGYRKTALQPGELLHSISIEPAFVGHHGYLRKVGTRKAQAISKIALAGLIRIENHVLMDVRLAAASLSEVPMRCRDTEQILRGRKLDRKLIGDARAALLSEVKPIDDIRSTSAYRSTVAANLLEEFLASLG